MKKTTIKMGLLTIVLGGVALCYFSSEERTTDVFDLTLANVEALASEEAKQPELNCRSAPRWICESLHPTDPSKDKREYNAKWDEE